MSRRDVREKIVQALYQLDFHRHGYTFADDWLAKFSDADKQFYDELFSGITSQLDQIDRQISQFLKGWTMARLSAIDRAILRLAAYELTAREDIPANVSLNEAVELAKRYSTDESARFINGVLSQFRKLQSSNDCRAKNQ